MTSPTWFFDGDKRRIYEVPPGATFTLDVNGYRIYGQGAGTAVMTSDVKADMWSRWVDWMADGNDWSLPAFTRSGGSIRPTGEHSPVDYQLQTFDGWRIVLANYPHETLLNGNLFAQGSDSLFDFTRLSAFGVVPRLQGSANLLTYTSDGGSNVSAQDLAAAVWAFLQANGATAETNLRNARQAAENAFAVSA
jgi:hypothetical protein